MRFAAGIGTALWGLSRHAFIATAVPISERGRAISVFGGINRIGTFAGPVVGGALAAWFDLPGVVRGGGADGGVVAAAGRALHQSRRRAPVSTGGGRGRWRVVGVVLRQNRRDLGAAALAQTFAQMIRAGRLFIIPIYGADVIGLGAGRDRADHDRLGAARRLDVRPGRCADGPVRPQDGGGAEFRRDGGRRGDDPARLGFHGV